MAKTGFWDFLSVLLVMLVIGWIAVYAIDHLTGRDIRSETDIEKAVQDLVNMISNSGNEELKQWLQEYLDRLSQMVATRENSTTYINYLQYYNPETGQWEQKPVTFTQPAGETMRQWSNSSEDLIANPELAMDIPTGGHLPKYHNIYKFITPTQQLWFRWRTRNPYNHEIRVKYAIIFEPVAYSISEYAGIPFLSPLKGDNVVIGDWHPVKTSEKVVIYQSQAYNINPWEDWYIKAVISAPPWLPFFDKGAFVVRLLAMVEENGEFIVRDADYVPSLTGVDYKGQIFLDTGDKGVLRLQGKLLVLKYRFPRNNYHVEDATARAMTGPEWDQYHAEAGDGWVKLVETSMQRDTLNVKVQLTDKAATRGVSFDVYLFRHDTARKYHVSRVQVYQSQGVIYGVSVPAVVEIPLDVSVTTPTCSETVILKQDIINNPDLYYVKISVLYNDKVVDVVRVGLYYPSGGE